jgi:protease I
VEGDLVSGRILTSWPNLRVDIENAGGVWTNLEVQVSTEGPNTLLTSRDPNDPDALNSALLAEFKRSPAVSST